MPVPTADPPSPTSCRSSDCCRDRFSGALDGPGVGRELLPQPHGYRILHVRSAGFENVMELFAFLGQRSGKAVEHRIKLLQLQQCCQPHRRRENVVRRLPVIHMVIGMDVLVLAARAAQQL